MLIVMATLGIAVAILWFQRRAVSTLQRATRVATRAAGIPAFRHSSQVVEQLARARRYQRPLTVTIVKLDEHDPIPSRFPLPGTGSADVRRAASSVLAFPYVACMLRDALRESDTVTYDPLMDRLVVVLLEVDKQNAEQCLKRLQTTIEHRTGLHMCFGCAEFPADGFTIEDVVAQAQTDVEGKRKKAVPAKGRGVPLEGSQLADPRANPRSIAGEAV